MIIAVDHGNSQIKTKSCVFPSAVKESRTKLPMAADSLKFDGMYYTLVNQRLFYRRDKTADNNFFILTLFGIAKELEAANAYLPGMDVELSVGLPPEHYAKQERRFCKYFLAKGNEIKFTYNDRHYRIVISKVHVFPQAYAAFCSEPDVIKNYQRAYIIDIGGYTVDVLLIADGQPDLSICRSLDMGVITMTNAIISHIDTNYELPIKEEHVMAVLTGKKTVLKPSVVKEIQTLAQNHVNELIAQLRELGVDLRADAAVLVGGGSILLKPFIDQSPHKSVVAYIPDIKANAKGYQILAELMSAS